MSLTWKKENKTEIYLAKVLNWRSFRHLLPFLLYHIPVLHFQGYHTANTNGK